MNPRKHDVHVAFRLPADLVERLDAYAEYLAAQVSVPAGMARPPVSRSEAARMLLTQALASVDANAPKTKPRKR